MDWKSRISTPLEAGTSILDAHRLPTFLTPALEYTSQRLADKGLHITLVVARKGYQLPNGAKTKSKAISTDVPVTELPSPPCSPTTPDGCRPGVTAIKSLVRSASQNNLRSTTRPDSRQSRRSKARPLSKKSSIASFFDGGLGSPLLRWSNAPNHSSSVPKAPRTPATPASLSTSNSSTTTSRVRGPLESQSEIRLIYTTMLAPRAHKLVAATLARAARKFNLSAPLTAHESSAYGLAPVVLHGSVLQNEVLHSSEGLTLLSLDHLYTFKAALNHYAATRSEPECQFRLEDAVDELRRYVLSTTGGRRRLLKSVLVAAYDWLGPVNDAALEDVMKMYSRAYGGVTGTGVEDDLVRDAAQAVAASQALAKVVDGDRELRLVTSVPEPPPKSAARIGRQTAAAAAAAAAAIPASSPVPAPALGSPVSLEDQRISVRSAITAWTPDFVESQPLLSPMSSNWVSEDYSPWPDEGLVNTRTTTPGQSPGLTPTTEDSVNIQAEEEKGVQERIVDNEKSVSTKTSNLNPKTPTEPLQHMPSISRRPPGCPQKIPSPRVSPRGSLPSLRIQTSFTTTPKPQDTPRREKTPFPSKSQSRQKVLEDLPVRSSFDKNIQTDINIADESDAESVLTEFEDAELTARSPAKTPGGSFWLGLDEMLGSGGARSGRGNSSLRKLQTPGGGRPGPDTPNGCEDISPITRGEWGFLMVGDPFKTKTAAVSCI